LSSGTYCFLQTFVLFATQEIQLLSVNSLIIKSQKMTKEIKTEILINARPERVWAILTAFDQYPNWNPFIKSITGEGTVGTQLVVRIEPPEATGMTFKPKVLAFEANKEFRWIGHLLFSGLFDGEHKFELIDHGNGTTTFIQSKKSKAFWFHFSRNNWITIPGGALWR
jgi:hypothetical protein